MNADSSATPDVWRRIAELEAQLAETVRIAEANSQEWHGAIGEMVVKMQAAEAQLAAAMVTLKWYAGDGSTYDGIDVGGRARDTLAALASAAPGETL